MDYGTGQSGSPSGPMSSSRIPTDDLNRLVEEVQKNVTGGDDGNFRGLWILTMVDHWNNNHEKVLLLMDRTVYIVKYDFIKKAIKDVKRIPLATVYKVQTGLLVYPPKSLMPPRNEIGLRLQWGEQNAMSLVQKWNPICKTLPYATLTYHPLFKKGAGADQEAETVYNVDNFAESLKDALRAFTTVEITNEEILIECYGNVSSMVFNQSNLGFSKDRNGMSF